MEHKAEASTSSTRKRQAPPNISQHEHLPVFNARSLVDAELHVLSFLPVLDLGELFFVSKASSRLVTEALSSLHSVSLSGMPVALSSSPILA